MRIGHLAVLGVGLIGGSLARALKKSGACDRITGFDRDTVNLERAVQLGVVDDYSTDAATAVAGADVIVLATPLAATESLLQAIREELGPGAVITDVGSAKGSVVEAARRVLGPGRLTGFIPGHPIAGREKSGVDASLAELFLDHLVILTPLPESDPDKVDLIRGMWKHTGARLVDMDVDTHDQVLAATSHLPHMLAYALVDCLAGMQEREEIFRYAAGGFTDFTRIASSSPEMWSDICQANSTNLLAMLDRFTAHLQEIRQAIATDDGRQLLVKFSRAKQARDDFIANHTRLKNSPE